MLTQEVASTATGSSQKDSCRACLRLKISVLMTQKNSAEARPVRMGAMNQAKTIETKPV